MKLLILHNKFVNINDIFFFVSNISALSAVSVKAINKGFHTIGQTRSVL